MFGFSLLFGFSFIDLEYCNVQVTWYFTVLYIPCLDTSIVIGYPFEAMPHIELACLSHV